MAKTISPGGSKYREFASNIYEILANFDANDSMVYVLIYKNRLGDIKSIPARSTSCIRIIGTLSASARP